MSRLHRAGSVLGAEGDARREAGLLIFSGFPNATVWEERQRGNRHGEEEGSKKEGSKSEGGAAFQVGVAESLRNARRFVGQDVERQAEGDEDLRGKFPFVPELFLAVLMSSYTSTALKAVLSTERVRSLDIWREFDEEMRAVVRDAFAGREQEVCDEYLRRFANICASLGGVTLKAEAERMEELRLLGKRFGHAPGDGNCLIWSLLHGLTDVGVLPQALVQNSLQAETQVQSCRSALVALPPDNPLRPMLRDLRTNQVVAEATAEQHANAFLQFDIHATWVMQYLLQQHGVEIPDRSIVCQ